MAERVRSGLGLWRAPALLNGGIDGAVGAIRRVHSLLCVVTFVSSNQ